MNITKIALKKIYKGKKEFLYECENGKNAVHPTTRNCAYTCRTPIKIINCTEIDDVFEKFTQYKESGLFEIKTFHSVSDKELDFVYNDFKKTINEYSLRYYPDNPMSKFIMAHFPKVWFE